QKYYWRVRGYHAEDVSEWSETREFTTDTLGARPTSPTNGAEERPVRLTLSVDRVSGSTTIEYELDTLPTFDSGNLQTYDHSDSYSGKIISNLDYGQKYYWRVRGYHAEDVSGWSETREFTTNPMGATQSSPSNGSTDRTVDELTLWVSDKLNGNDSIDYQLDTTTSFNSDLLEEQSHASTYSGKTFNGLRYGQEYYWRVRGRHEEDTSEWTEPWIFKTEFELPEGPNLESPESSSVDMPYENVSLNWNSLDNVDTYQYQVSLDENFTQIIRTGNTSLIFASVSDLNPLTQYFWRVRGENVNGYSPWSDIWNFTTESIELEEPVLSSPADESIINNDAVTFEWDEVFGASEYVLELSVDESFESSVSSFSTDNNEWEVTGLPMNYTFYWRVKATDASNEGSWSEVWSFNLQEQSLDSPALVSPENNADEINPEHVTFQWTTIEGATNYRLEVSLNDDFESLFFTSTTDLTTLDVNGFQCEAAYYWRVKALDGSIESDWSDTWSYTTTSCSGVGFINPNAVTLYPNPANDYIMLDYSNEFNKEIELKIFSINGALVNSHRITKNNRVSIKNLSAGIYIVQLIHDRTVVGSVRFVKK
ncbi:MAG: T9SS type A sorting domain-containing protein, partial [Bacteroidales bacterium]